MNDVLTQQLSEFIDGELAPDEAELLVRRLDSDEQLRALANRFHLIGSVLRQERVVDVTFIADLAKALEQEPALSALDARGSKQRVSGFARIATGGAIAAGVAMIAIFALQRPAALDDSDGPLLGSVESNPKARESVEAPDYVVPRVAIDPTPRMITEPRIVNYYLRHNQTAPTIRRRNIDALMSYDMAEPKEANSSPVNSATDRSEDEQRSEP